MLIAAKRPIIDTLPRPEPKPEPSLSLDFTNSLGMRMIHIVPGEFLMGSSQEEVDAAVKEIPAFEADTRSEAPQRWVKLTEPFYLGACEVTVGQFRRFVEATTYRSRAEVNGQGGIHWDNKANAVVADVKDIWSNPRFGAADDCPVGVVTHPDAQAFCDWLSATEGIRYGLPDEDQWEYACRAGSTGRWCSGDDPDQVKKFGWVAPDAGQTSHPVGRKLANAFGLFDMHGNLGECVVNAQGARVLRGGHHDFSPWQCRSAARTEMAPGDYPCWVTMGFRVAVVGDLSKFKQP